MLGNPGFTTIRHHFQGSLSPLEKHLLWTVLLTLLIIPYCIRSQRILKIWFSCPSAWQVKRINEMCLTSVWSTFHSPVPSCWWTCFTRRKGHFYLLKNPTCAPWKLKKNENLSKKRERNRKAWKHVYWFSSYKYMFHRNETSWIYWRSFFINKIIIMWEFNGGIKFSLC